MVTLQILVLSFLVRIQVAQQSGRFSIAFFVVCVEARGSFRPAWCWVSGPRCKHQSTPLAPRGKALSRPQWCNPWSLRCAA